MGPCSFYFCDILIYFRLLISVCLPFNDTVMNLQNYFIVILKACLIGICFVYLLTSIVFSILRHCDGSSKEFCCLCKPAWYGFIVGRYFFTYLLCVLVSNLSSTNEQADWSWALGPRHFNHCRHGRSKNKNFREGSSFPFETVLGRKIVTFFARQPFEKFENPGYATECKEGGSQNFGVWTRQPPPGYALDCSFFLATHSQDIGIQSCSLSFIV